MFRRIYYNPVGEVESSMVHAENDDILRFLYNEMIIGRIFGTSIQSVTLRNTNNEVFVYLKSE